MLGFESNRGVVGYGLLLLTLAYLPVAATWVSEGRSVRALVGLGVAVVIATSVAAIVRARQRETIIVRCPHCDGRTRFPSLPGKTLIVSCPRGSCGGRFEFEVGAEPVPLKRFDVKARDRGEQLCPWCRASLASEARAQCAGCATECHVECLEELGPACPVCKGSVEVKGRAVRA